MYTRQIKNVPKNQRAVFKKMFYEKDNRIKVTPGPADTMTIQIPEPYAITEEWLKTKAEILNNKDVCLADFRQWQFNQKI